MHDQKGAQSTSLPHLSWASISNFSPETSSPPVCLMLTYIAQLATIFLLGAIVIQLLRLVATQMQQTQAQEIAKLKAQLKEARDDGVAKCELLWEIQKIARLPLDASSVEAARGRGWAGNKVAKNMPKEFSNQLYKMENSSGVVGFSDRACLFLHHISGSDHSTGDHQWIISRQLTLFKDSTQASKLNRCGVKLSEFRSIGTLLEFTKGLPNGKGEDLVRI